MGFGDVRRGRFISGGIRLDYSFNVSLGEVRGVFIVWRVGRLLIVRGIVSGIVKGIVKGHSKGYTKGHSKGYTKGDNKGYSKG